MQPYYEHDGITIYHGDCREVIPAVRADAVVTDPPYGVGLGVDNHAAKSGGYGGHLGKAAYTSFEDSYQTFVDVVVPRLTAAIHLTGRAAVFTGPHIHEQLKPDAIGGIWSPAAAGRTPWGSKNFLPVLFYGKPSRPGLHRPTVLRSAATSDINGHPCPKPIEWMRWLVLLAAEAGETILDPFMGSGTTLRAAKDLGVRAVGVEIEERYCEIAAQRLAQNVLPFPVDSRATHRGNGREVSAAIPDLFPIGPVPA